MASQIMSLERLRKSAQSAVQRPGVVDCPPEFDAYRNVWIEEYRRALLESNRELAHG